MRSLFVTLCLSFVFTTTALAQGYGYGANPRSTNVGGYMRQDGNYVQPYQRTMPDQTDYNNYGTRGNFNPNTGQQGSQIPRRY